MANTKSTLRRERGVTFPIRFGELDLLKEALGSVDLGTAFAPSFVDAWCNHAWLFLSVTALNELAGTVPIPLEGRWSPTELRVESGNVTAKSNGA